MTVRASASAWASAWASASSWAWASAWGSAWALRPAPRSGVAWAGRCGLGVGFGDGVGGDEDLVRDDLLRARVRILGRGGRRMGHERPCSRSGSMRRPRPSRPAAECAVSREDVALVAWQDVDDEQEDRGDAHEGSGRVAPEAAAVGRLAPRPSGGAGKRGGPRHGGGRGGRPGDHDARRACRHRRRGRARPQSRRRGADDPDPMLQHVLLDVSDLGLDRDRRFAAR